MRRLLAMASTVMLAGALLGSMLAGPASAVASCKATAANPTADNGATITASGTGSCSGVASVEVKVCLQFAEHSPAGTTWSNWGGCDKKTPAPGTTVTVKDTEACSAGHAYQVRTRTVSTGFNASGGQVAQKAVLSSRDGVTRNCHN